MMCSPVVSNQQREEDEHLANIHAHDRRGEIRGGEKTKRADLLWKKIFRIRVIVGGMDFYVKIPKRIFASKNAKE
jgi:hypothetical protein